MLKQSQRPAILTRFGATTTVDPAPLFGEHRRWASFFNSITPRPAPLPGAVGVGASWSCRQPPDAPRSR
jgi:hypothetical protein